MTATTRYLCVLCEGETEEKFVNHVLRPYLESKGVVDVVRSIVLLTNRKQGIRGGIQNYGKVTNDLVRIFKQQQECAARHYVVTTMFDYYALPADFPGYVEAEKIHNALKRVELLENSFREDVSQQYFVPYIQLHEFEALVFCGLQYLSAEYPGIDIAELQKALEEQGNNPEKINNTRETSPSHRIEKVLRTTCRTKKYKYNKPGSGYKITRNVGVEALRAQCPHFSNWIERIEDALGVGCR